MVQKHFEYWAAHGYEVSQVTSWFPGLAREEVINGVKTYRRKRRRYLWVFGWYYFLKIFGGKADLVVDQFHGLPYFSPIWFWGPKIAVIHEVPGIIWDKTFPFPINIFGKLLDFINLLFYRFVHVWTISDSTRDDLIRYGVPKKNLQIIYNGANLDPLLKVPEKYPELTLLSVNRLSRMKRIEDIIDAFALMVKQEPKAKLIIVGWAQGAYPEFLGERAKKLGVESKVEFTGYVSSSEKTKLYQKSHFLLHTSVKEGWGMVVIEGNTQGTPTIGYNVGGLRDSIKEGVNGLLTSQNNPQEVASLVLQTWRDRGRYQKLCKTSLEYSKDFPWEKFLKQGLEMVEKEINK